MRAPVRILLIFHFRYLDQLLVIDNTHNCCPEGSYQKLGSFTGGKSERPHIFGVANERQSRPPYPRRERWNPLGHMCHPAPVAIDETKMIWSGWLKKRRAQI